MVHYPVLLARAGHLIAVIRGSSPDASFMHRSTAGDSALQFKPQDSSQYEGFYLQLARRPDRTLFETEGWEFGRCFLAFLVVPFHARLWRTFPWHPVLFVWFAHLDNDCSSVTRLLSVVSPPRVTCQPIRTGKMSAFRCRSPSPRSLTFSCARACADRSTFEIANPRLLVGSVPWMGGK